MAIVSEGPGLSDGLGWALENYVILKPIASGRFGSVYHARHVTADHTVALKLIPRQGADGDEKVAAERHGAMLQQRFCLAHRGLVPEVFEHGPMGGFYGIAMEFVDGTQLTELLKAGPLPASQVATIALAICDFLERAHQFKTTIEDVPYEFIVHADLKPDHILIVGENQIRVLDFGIAKALEARSLVTTNKWGSLQYASPERLQSDGHVDRHTDFWSLGVMLFEMVAGYRPYRQHEYSLSRLDRAIRTGEPPEPLPPGTDSELAAVIRKLLAPQIERRYSSAAVIAKDLEAYLQGQTTTAGAELARAGQETVRVARGDEAPEPKVPPPLPWAVGATAAQPTKNPAQPALSPAAQTSTQTPAKRTRPSFMRRTLRFVTTVVLLLFAAAEASSLSRAERFRARVPMLEPSDVSTARAAYLDAVDGAPFGFGARRLARSIKDRMVELADRAILDYRTESPTVISADWQRARVCLQLAREMAPQDNQVAAKYTYVIAQLSRIAARTRDDSDRAIRQFRESSRLDPTAPDPYLGLARMAAYVTLDVEALRHAIEAAQSRGYTSGRRERAQFGDLHKTLADRARAAAVRLSGELRLEQLHQAADGYAKCVEQFDGLHYFDSDTNLLACRRRLDEVNGQIEHTTLTLQGSDLFGWLSH